MFFHLFLTNLIFTCDTCDSMRKSVGALRRKGVTGSQFNL